MCLAVPGKILEIHGDEPMQRRGKVSFGGIIKEISLAFVPEASVDDYILAHAGVALNVIDDLEANRVFEYLEQIGRESNREN